MLADQLKEMHEIDGKTKSKDYIQAVNFGRDTSARICNICLKHAYYRIAGIFRGVYISQISRKGPSSLILKPQNVVN